MVAPCPPVDGGAVDDGGQDVFVGEGGGEGPRFVSMGDLEDQVVVTAAVDLIPQVLKGKITV